MKDDQRQDPRADRVEDLEVRDDEARDIAGGKKKAGVRYGKKAAGRMASEPVNERSKK